MKVEKCAKNAVSLRTNLIHDDMMHDCIIVILYLYSICSVKRLKS